MSYFPYGLMYALAVFVLLPFEYFKRPAYLRKRWLREKFGFITPPERGRTKDAGGKTIWVHAVSVGEVIAAIPLLKRLRETYPSGNIVLSTITDTGQEVAGERMPEGVSVIYLPFDIHAVLDRAVRRIKPELLIIMETELWPNLFRTCHMNNVSVILLNGRISEKSFKGYSRISFFMKKVLSFVDFFGMQNEEYAERIRSLGVDGGRVMNIGNFKFDAVPPSRIPVWAERLKKPVLIAGSTHDGEEELITSVYTELKRDFPGLNLLIAPRHPERFNEVETILKAKKVSYIRRSALGSRCGEKMLDGAKESVTPQIEGYVLLLDSVGELSSVYGISDIAIIGKSFRGQGGQNPLEPASWGKPIVCGPHMENFPVIKEFYRAGAALEVPEEELFSTLKELLSNPEKAAAVGGKAQELYRNNSGAVERALEIIKRYVE
ncbi:MAG: 3-deoxy-D-manno-octulosonic acid transferase [Nitrospirota bacterium]